MTKYQEGEINTLIGAVIGELKKRRYSDSYIGGLSTVWNRLTKYLKKRNTSVYSAKIGLDFLEAERFKMVASNTLQTASHLV